MHIVISGSIPDVSIIRIKVYTLLIRKKGKTKNIVINMMPILYIILKIIIFLLNIIKKNAREAQLVERNSEDV